MLIPNNKYYEIFGGTPSNDYDEEVFDGIYLFDYTDVRIVYLRNLV